MELPNSAQILVENLLAVTRIFSPSSMEQEMTEYCSNFLYDYGFNVRTDNNGNIMAVRGSSGNRDKYVLLNAHMDTYAGAMPIQTKSIQTPYDIEIGNLSNKYRILQNEISDFERRMPRKDFVDRELMIEYHQLKQEIDEVEMDHAILSKLKYDLPYVQTHKMVVKPGYWKPECIKYFDKTSRISAKTKDCKEIYVGGDDKAGVGLILTLAQLSDQDCKILLTVREEPPFGRKGGVMDIPPEFFNDVYCDLTFDKGFGNLLVDMIHNTRLCPKELTSYISGVAKEHCGLQYQLTGGLMCDAEIICKYVPSVNISNGSYEPHHPGDYIVVPETHKAMCVASRILWDYNSY